MTWHLLLLPLGAVLLFAAYVRIAPSDPGRWHLDLERQRPDVMRYALRSPGAEIVRPVENGAYADLAVGPAEARDLLAKLDAIAMATPRTTRLAGSAMDGHLTWVTRSALWGFPDYTTAQVTPNGLTIYGRLRFGAHDRGVNRRRVRDWLSQL